MLALINWKFVLWDKTVDYNLKTCGLLAKLQKPQPAEVFDVNGMDLSFVILDLELIIPCGVRYHTIFILPQRNSETVK